MMRSVAKRITGLLWIMCVLVFALSFMVALAHAGLLGESGDRLRAIEFKVWVVILEVALCVAGAGLATMMFVRIDDPATTDAATSVDEAPLAFDQCPTCSADLRDLAFGVNEDVWECPNCGQDLEASEADHRAGSVMAAPST